MRKRTALLCLFIAACAQPAAAQNAGNLAADFYPRSKCDKPDINKVNRTDATETIRYNLKIKQYNVCNKDYLANARNDVDYVLAMINAEVAAVNGQSAPPLPSAPGNMPPGFYPASTCVKPDKAAIGEMPSTQKVPVVNGTGKPKTAEGQQAFDAMAAYNARVTQYNAQVIAFDACSKDYVAKGRIDMAHIQAASQETIKASE